MPKLDQGNLPDDSWSHIWDALLRVDADAISSYSEMATRMHDEPDVLERMENSECYQTFSADYVPDYASVILMTNVTTAENPLLEVNIHRSAVQQEPFQWFGDEIDTSHWYLGYSTNAYRNASISSSSTAMAAVEYCLVQSLSQDCTVEIFTGLLWTVIICNLVKVVCFIALLYTRFTPLITTGDAVASFLADPDSTTELLGPYAAHDSKGRENWRGEGPPFRWNATRYWWFRGASKKRWICTGLVLVTLHARIPLSLATNLLTLLKLYLLLGNRSTLTCVS